MATDPAATPPAATPPPPDPLQDSGSPEATLKPGAIGFVSSMVIGLASTSPAYSLAAILGPMVALLGVYAPGALLASFVPMLLIASAFYYLNRVDSDCGTTFSWVTRAMGPWFGWIGGWAIGMTGVLVVGSLANVGVTYFLLAIGADELVDNEWLVRALTVALILVMTAICVIGTELSAHFQDVLIIAQVIALIAFAGTALYAAFAGTSEFGSITPEWGWLNPFGAGGAALTGGLLLGVFAYWGWESAVNLNEETEGASSTPGRAAIASTIVLLVTYVSVAIAVVAYAGVDYLTENADEEEAIFGSIADSAMGGWSWVLLLAVSTSAIASTQTTIIPASRTGLSMARRHALPKSMGHIHPRFRTPDVSTWTVAVIAIVWYLVVDYISENALFDSLTALSLLIAFYYGLTGIACAIYYRHELIKSVKNFVLIGVGPVIGAVLLFWLLVESIIDMSDPANSYTGEAWFGVGPPLVIGVGVFLAGILFMIFWRIKDGRYWQEKPGVADPVLAAGGSRDADGNEVPR